MASFPSSYINLYWTRQFTWHTLSKQSILKYAFSNQVSEQVKSTKVLGVAISDSLNTGEHVSDISSRATKVLVFLHWNLFLASRETKEAAYKTLVNPKLEYIVTICNPDTQALARQIEKV